MGIGQEQEQQEGKRSGYSKDGTIENCYMFKWRVNYSS